MIANTKRLRPVLLFACVALLSDAVVSQEAKTGAMEGSNGGHQMSMRGDGHGGMSMEMMRADSHAPLGVMGADTMMKGMWMLSYRYMRMEMDGNLIGEDSVSPEQIVTTVPNRFFGLPGQPPPRPVHGSRDLPRARGHHPSVNLHDRSERTRRHQADGTLSCLGVRRTQGALERRAQFAHGQHR
jgi:hypothetical protein